MLDLKKIITEHLENYTKQKETSKHQAVLLEGATQALQALLDAANKKEEEENAKDV